MAVDRYGEIRERISAIEAARAYGLEFDSQGKRCRCCYHSPDRHPSMSFRNGRFRCWSCGVAGSSIDLTAQLFGLTVPDAARRLNNDFALCLNFDKEPTPEERREAARRRKVRDTYRLFEAWRNEAINQLNAAFRLAHTSLQSLTDPADVDKLTDSQTLAIQEQARVEWLADTLTHGEMKDMLAIFEKRGEVERLCRRILNNSSNAAASA